MFVRPCLLLCLACHGAVHADELSRSLDVSTRVSPELLAPVNGPTRTLEQTVWARRGKLAVGMSWQGRVQNLRVDGPVSALSRNDPASRLHMGLAVDVSERARIELSKPFEQNVTSTALNGQTTSNDGVRLSLELKSSKPMAGLRNGVRLAVTSQSQVLLKPRRGGLAVYYNGNF